ncbi:NAD(+)/NADH kinase [Parahaliea sp. F7430]|uniref:NAD(+)/NADH kinase n=1 Tax=Sediminihaliea albiluteola TaxID=2758564 RepID=A0A7W2YKI4_9GAMM|nr:NAD(+)/NADH kinase [Sediminihaliea albiluteola]
MERSDKPSDGAARESPVSDKDHRPFFIVLNGGSGQGGADEAVQLMDEVLASSNRQYEIIKVEQSSTLSAVAEWAVKQAQAQNGIVVAAGGDGTLNAVCQALAGTGIPLGLVPLGTFNYFARNYGIPQDTTLATRCLLDAQLRPIQAGFVNEKIFLVNASLGIYPKLLEDREAYKQNLGRSRVVAFLSALATFMRAHRKLRIDVSIDGEQRPVITSSLVVANNALQLEHIGLGQSEALAQGQLVAVLVKPMGRLALYALLLRGLVQRLGEADNLDGFTFSEMRVSRGRAHRAKIALDGEVSWMQLPLQFKARENALNLLVPSDPQMRERL